VPPAAPPGRPLRRRPPGRYDEPSRTTARALAVVLVVLFAGLVATITWTLFQRYGTPSTDVQVRGYSVLSDRAVRVDVDVAPPRGRTVFCLLRARDRHGVEVGRVFVPVTGGTGGSVRLRQVVPTTGRAVTGEAPQCTVAAPPPDEPTAAPQTPPSP
jgi:hypothetical protein